MPDTFASLRQQTPGISAAAASGGNLTGGTYYLWAYALNRAGGNLLQSLGSVSPTSGQKITVSIASTAKATGEDIYEWGVCGNSTNNPATAVQLASKRYRDAASITYPSGSVDYPGEGAARSFPLTIELSRDAHVATSGLTVANLAALPTGVNLVHGMVRQVTSLGGKWVQYDSEATTGDHLNGSNVWNEVNGPYPNLSSTTAARPTNGLFGGCDRALANLGTDIPYPVPPYPVLGAAQSPAPIYWIQNDGSSAIAAGTLYNWRIFRSGEAHEGALTDLVKATFLGVVTLSTGVLNTGVAGVGTETLYKPNSRNLVIPAQVNAGQAAAFSVAMQFSASQAPTLPTGVPYYVRFESAGTLGSYNPAGGGDKVLPGGDLMRIVPSTLGVKRLGGQVRVAGYDSPLLTDTQDATGLDANTADQQVAINAAAGGSIRLADAGATLGSAEALRALVGTDGDTSSGFVAQNTGWSSPVSVGSGQIISVTVSHPVDSSGNATVRADYPDVIAGNGAAEFNVPNLRVYVRKSGTIYQAPTDEVAINDETQQFTITANVTAWSTVGSIPTPTDVDFGLFTPSGISASATSGSGAITTGSYEVLVAYLYDGDQATRISHATADGCISESTLSDADLIEVSQSVGSPVSTYAQLRNIGASDRYPYKAWYVVEDLNEYRWLPAETTNQEIELDWDTGTSLGAGSGEIRANNASPASVTALYVSESDRNAVSTSTLLASIETGQTILLHSDNLASPSVVAKYTVSGAITDNGSDRTIPVTYVSHTGTFSDGADVLLSFGQRYIRPFDLTRSSAGRFVRAATPGPAGPQGNPGSAGADGTPGLGIRYTFSTSTSSGPSSGQIRLNNATYSSATQIFVSETARTSVSAAAVLDQLTAGSVLMLFDENDDTAYAFYTLTSSTDNGGDRTLAVTHLASNGTFTGNVSLAFVIKGAAGSTGATGSTGAAGADGVSGFGLRYTFSTSTSTGPSSGQLRFNNATYSSATAIYLHETDRLGSNIASLLSTIADGSPLLVLDDNDSSAYAYFTLSNQTDNGSDRTFTVTHIASAGTLSGNVSLTFAARGATGATGSVSAATSLDFTQIATPSAPSAGTTKIYAKSDGLIYRLNSTGSESPLGTNAPTVTLTEQASTPSTPASGFQTIYPGTDGYFYRLKSDGTRLRVADVIVEENQQTGTSYTLALGDQYEIVTLANASAITLTIPTNASVAFPIGTQIVICQDGAGQVTVSPAGGVTMRSRSSANKLSGQYSFATLWKEGTNTWYLFGDVTT